jgi:hypothetical protein
MTLTGGTRTFVVRIWREPGTAEPEGDEVRGEVRDVLSGELRYFRLMQGLLEAVRLLMDIDHNHGRFR